MSGKCLLHIQELIICFTYTLQFIKHFYTFDSFSKYSLCTNYVLSNIQEDGHIVKVNSK